MSEPFGRRGFLDPRGMLKAAADWQQSVEQSLDTLERFASEPVVTLRRPAMACMFEIQFGALEADRRPALEAFDVIDDVESLLSIYRADSPVSRVNAAGHPDPIAVPDELMRLLKRCGDFTRETEGAFDVTAGPLVRTWGFADRQGRVPSEEELAAALEKVGFEKLVLDQGDSSVRFALPGMELNFGAIGKGYALDRVHSRLTAAGFGPCLVSAGHSSILALGSPSWDDAWQIDLRHPLDANRVLARVPLRDRALSTSGIAEQSFVAGGRRHGHLLDPRTGRPVEGMLQATVVAPNATTAEVLSTAMFVLGVDWAAAYCRRHPDIGALLVRDALPTGPPASDSFGLLQQSAANEDRRQ